MISYYLKYLTLAVLFVSVVSFAQSNNSSENFSIGYGNSMYKDINTEQLLLLYKVPQLSVDFGNLSLNGDLNLELISHNKSTVMVAGFVPMLRYYLNLGFTKTFLSLGIGFNYLNNHNIGSRNLGSHFIFSDNLSIGTKLIDNEYFKVEVSYLFRHISNAGIFSSNEGFNSQYLVLSLTI
ncbi:MAG: acyloxyacyl hydrolase [Ignavibacteriaceae bacterium]